MIPHPMAILLTHRRGAAVAILKNNFNDEEFNFSGIHIENEVEDPYEFIHLNGKAIFARVLGKTAENLANLYQFCLKQLSLECSDIKTLAVGIGPGSFTGLRLGCAFANGLSLGKPSNLLPVTTHFISDILTPMSDTKLEQEFKRQLGEYSHTDESSGYVTFFDLKLALSQVKEGKRSFVTSLVPEYAKDPSPLAKLKGMSS